MAEKDFREILSDQMRLDILFEDYDTMCCSLDYPIDHIYYQMLPAEPSADYNYVYQGYRVTIYKIGSARHNKYVRFMSEGAYFDYDYHYYSDPDFLAELAKFVKAPFREFKSVKSMMKWA